MGDALIKSGKRGRLKCLCVWHSVPERASYGTEYACRAQKGFLWYATHLQRHSVRKNRLLRYGRDIRCQKQPPVVRDASSKARRTADSTDCRQLPGVRDASSEACRAKSSLLPHRTHLQCAKRPPRSLFAPAAPSLAPSTALGTRNVPRSEVSRHKKRDQSQRL